MAKTIKEINERIKQGKAVVVTAEEVIELVEKKGFKKESQEVDVVTTGTFVPIHIHAKHAHVSFATAHETNRHAGHHLAGLGLALDEVAYCHEFHAHAHRVLRIHHMTDSAAVCLAYNMIRGKHLDL